MRIWRSGVPEGRSQLWGLLVRVLSDTSEQVAKGGGIRESSELRESSISAGMCTWATGRG